MISIPNLLLYENSPHPLLHPVERRPHRIASHSRFAVCGSFCGPRRLACGAAGAGGELFRPRADGAESLLHRLRCAGADVCQSRTAVSQAEARHATGQRGDSRDTNGDGVADEARTFATGFNCIQGLAWHGRDLWVANAPDLTVVRDIDGDDVADEYIRVFTDLGNIEHGLHGLNWAPDGKLYMSKGNSKGLVVKDWKKDEPDRIAPKPFRDLWGVPGPTDAPDFPSPKTFTRQTYKSTYQDPEDDWGRSGGVLRCEDMGRNLEIVARGSAQSLWHRLRCGFRLARHGSGSERWRPPLHAVLQRGLRLVASAGARTGRAKITCPPCPSAVPCFRAAARACSSRMRRTGRSNVSRRVAHQRLAAQETHVYRPTWEGALMQPQGGQWEDFITGGKCAVSSSGHGLRAGGRALHHRLEQRLRRGAGSKDGNMTNEGRVFRVMPKGAAETPRAVCRRSCLT